MQHLETALVVVYGLASLGLFLYGLNCYVLIGLFIRHRHSEASRRAAFFERFWADPPELPRVTTQLPIFNERFVAERLIRAVAAIDWPRDRHEIQVLDDSTDETQALVASLVAELRATGIDIVHLHRANREGWKAGALQAGLRSAKGDYLAIFDADFLPDPIFLRRTIPFFFDGPRVAMVQTRWGHVNRGYSLLTRAQAIGIDGHFVIEQGARTWHGLFMNFNGTAGVWRRAAIEDAGGWRADTLTEDLDLSYRVQLRGWRMRYLHEVVTPSELPIDINGFKAQQHRWAKGSIQVARAMLPRVFRAPIGSLAKVQAFFHLTHYAIHPLIVTVAVLAYPALAWFAQPHAPRWLAGPALALLALSTLAPSLLYLLSQRATYHDWVRRALLLPALMAIGIGIALNNSRAVLEALVGHRGGFVRTPKYGVVAPGEALDRRRRAYSVRPRLGHWLELALGLYSAWTVLHYVTAGRWLAIPILLLNAIGFTTVGCLSTAHSRRSRPGAV